MVTDAIALAAIHYLRHALESLRPRRRRAPEVTRLPALLAVISGATKSGNLTPVPVWLYAGDSRPKATRGRRRRPHGLTATGVQAPRAPRAYGLTGSRSNGPALRPHRLTPQRLMAPPPPRPPRAHGLTGSRAHGLTGSRAHGRNSPARPYGHTDSRPQGPRTPRAHGLTDSWSNGSAPRAPRLRTHELTAPRALRPREPDGFTEARRRWSDYL
jgi:hypothetical protein